VINFCDNSQRSVTFAVEQKPSCDDVATASAVAADVVVESSAADELQLVRTTVEESEKPFVRRERSLRPQSEEFGAECKIYIRRK
jgi:hypothetical protein